MILVPAFGRDYSNISELRRDWDAGKDFKILGGNGMYTSIRDVQRIREDGFGYIEIRYAKRLKAVLVNMNTGRIN